MKFVNKQDTHQKVTLLIGMVQLNVLLAVPLIMLASLSKQITVALLFQGLAQIFATTTGSMAVDKLFLVIF